jgi:CRP-like cAMP-binding protein
MERKVPHSLVQTLRGIPDFATLDEKALLRIVGESMNLQWRAGSTIFEPGQAGDALFMILSGEVSITNEDGTEVVHPSRGDFFGEMSLLMNATHTKRANAVTNCEILVLPKDAFHEILDKNPPLAEHFQRVLNAKRPRELSRER